MRRAALRPPPRSPSDCPPPVGLLVAPARPGPAGTATGPQACGSVVRPSGSARRTDPENQFPARGRTWSPGLSLELDSGVCPQPSAPLPASVPSGCHLVAEEGITGQDPPARSREGPKGRGALWGEVPLRSGLPDVAGGARGGVCVWGGSYQDGSAWHSDSWKLETHHRVTERLSATWATCTWAETKCCLVS